MEKYTILEKKKQKQDKLKCKFLTCYVSTFNKV